MLNRNRRCISCIILGIVALVAAIASATTSGVALSQSIANVRTLDKDAVYLHDLAKNVSHAFRVQNEINAQLFSAVSQVAKDVEILNQQVQHLTILSKLRCDYRFSYFCLLPVVVNTSLYPFDKIKQDLQGLWLRRNVSADIENLNRIINDIDSSIQQDLTPEHIADQWYKWWEKGRAIWSPIGHFVLTSLTFVAVILIVILCLPCILQILFRNLASISKTLQQHRALLTKRGNCSDGPASSPPIEIARI